MASKKCEFKSEQWEHPFLDESENMLDTAFDQQASHDSQLSCEGMADVRSVHEQALGQAIPQAGSQTEAHVPTFSFGERPQIVLTWGSEFPDKIKLRKSVHIWPLRFGLRFDYTSATRAVNFGCSCQDSLLGGKIQTDLTSQELEYKKLLNLGGSQLSLTARCSYAGLLTGKNVNPRAGLAFEIGAGAAMWAGNVFDLRQKLRLSRNVGLELCGSAQLPVPRAQYTVSSEQQQMAFGEGPLHLHVAQLNACLDL